MTHVTNKRKQNDSESQAPAVASTKTKKNDDYDDDRFGPVLSALLPTIFSFLDWKTVLSVVPLVSKEWKLRSERDELWGPHLDKISHTGDLLTEELPNSRDLLLFPLPVLDQNNEELEPEIPGESRRRYQLCCAYRRFVLCEDYWTRAKAQMGTLPPTPGVVDVDVFDDFHLPMGLEKLASRILSAPGASHLNYCYHMLEIRFWEYEEIMDTHVLLRVFSDPQNVWMACISFNMAFPEPDPPVYIVAGWEVPTDLEDLRLISKRLSSFMDQYGRFIQPWGEYSDDGY
jgi:hypothetical protein